MPRMKVVQVAQPNADLEIVERDIPNPKAREVRIKVQACGICHSDMFTVAGAFPGIQYPRVPGISYDGGYAEYMIAPFEALASVPDDLSSEDAAPLLCAGITMFNSLRHSGAQSGDLVAIHGIGGLGHLGVQFAAKMGFRTVAIARGADKGPLAKKLGADIYIDSTVQNAAEELTKLGGAKIILATVTDAKAMSSVIGGLGIDGKLLIVGAAGEPIEVPPILLIMGRRSITGWPSGTATDSEDTLKFSVAENVRPMIETFPLAKAKEAYQRMMSGKSRFRVVLTP